MQLKSDNVKRAFLFDMDGVLVGSEHVWLDFQQDVRELLGEDTFASLDRSSVVGVNIHRFYTMAKEHGLRLSEEEFYTGINEIAAKLYAKAALSEGVLELVQLLRELGYHMGIVSSSPRAWIDCCLARLPIADAMEVIVSVNHEPDLKPKPAPDGYVRAMEVLGVGPEHTIVLEDSNTGIEAAKVAGALVIGYTEHLFPDYVQEGADMYLDSMEEVAQWIRYISSQSSV